MNFIHTWTHAFKTTIRTRSGLRGHSRPYCSVPSTPGVAPQEWATGRNRTVRVLPIWAPLAHRRSLGCSHVAGVLGVHGSSLPRCCPCRRIWRAHLFTCVPASRTQCQVATPSPAPVSQPACEQPDMGLLLASVCLSLIANDTRLPQLPSSHPLC